MLADSIYSISTVGEQKSHLDANMNSTFFEFFQKICPNSLMYKLLWSTETAEEGLTFTLHTLHYNLFAHICDSVKRMLQFANLRNV